MTRDEYERNYLSSFNNKDYAKVLSFWAPQFSVVLQEHVLFDSPEALIKFYNFLNGYVKEEIFIDRFLSDESSVFMEAKVRISAFATLSQEAIENAGISGIMPIEAGVTYDIPQFIHYHLENGLFTKGVCLISGPVVPV